MSETAELAGMYVLSVTQPWASLLAIGAKRIETRSWSTHHRGPVLIHASKGMPGWARECCDESPFAEALAAGGLSATTLPRGAIIARARLASVLHTGSLKLRRYLAEHPDEAAFGDFGPDRWGWCLVDVEPLPEPIPARGQLGLWTYQPTETPAHA